MHSGKRLGPGCLFCGTWEGARARDRETGCPSHWRGWGPGGREHPLAPPQDTPPGALPDWRVRVGCSGRRWVVGVDSGAARGDATCGGFSWRSTLSTSHSGCEWIVHLRCKGCNRRPRGSKWLRASKWKVPELGLDIRSSQPAAAEASPTVGANPWESFLSWAPFRTVLLPSSLPVPYPQIGFDAWSGFGAKNAHGFLSPPSLGTQHCLSSYWAPLTPLSSAAQRAVLGNPHLSRSFGATVRTRGYLV